MNTIDMVHEADIDCLSPDKCVRLFADLLYCDAWRINLSASKVTITSKTATPDGGIDATVEGDIEQEGDLIVNPQSFYQIKSGKNFDPWKSSEIEKELFGEKPSSKESLGREVRRCFEQNGTYILVCMKKQMNSMQRNDAEKNLLKILTSCGINNPDVSVWGQDKILSTISRYPSVARRLTNRGDLNFVDHGTWSQHLNMKTELELGSSQGEFIKNIRREIDKDSGTAHVNIQGETGIGKTRLVLEATKDESLAPLVIYCKSPRECTSGRLLQEIVRNELDCILVVDRCKNEDRIDIWNELSSVVPRAKLVTISNEYSQVDETATRLVVPKLDHDEIKRIIMQYHDDGFWADQLARICNGIPSVAHKIGKDLKNHSKILLDSQDESWFTNMYVAAGEDPKSDMVRRRKIILRAISLFDKFGTNEHFDKEFETVHAIVAKVDPGITSPIFQECVEEMRDRKVLQGINTLHIHPKYLHLWLWNEWWKYHNIIKLEDLVSKIYSTPVLLGWFVAMFQYAKHSDAATKALRDLFKVGGPLSGPEPIRSNLGAELFRTLANADPMWAVGHLEAIMGQWQDEDLRSFTDGRRSVVRALERIVFEPDLFVRGGRLLRRLAENENDGGSNNSAYGFTRLFLLETDYASPTKATPKERLQLLAETLCAQDEKRRSLGLNAYKLALVEHASVLGSDEDELTAEKGWTPQTYGEWADGYKLVMELVAEKMQDLPSEAQRLCAEILVNNFRSLLHRFPFMSGYILDKLSEIMGLVDKEAMITKMSEILNYERDRLDHNTKSRLESMLTGIVGTDYPSLMRRYVGMHIFTDLVDDNRDDRAAIVRDLAKASLDLDVLEPELPWLVTDEAKLGDEFGEELARQDEGFVLLPVLMDAQKKAADHRSGLFIGGYMSVVLMEDRGRWFHIIDEFCEDSNLTGLFTYVVRRSGIDDDIAMMVLEQARSGKIRASELRMFVVGGMINKISERIVTEWIKHMMDSDDGDAVSGALDVFHSFFIHWPKKSQNQGIKRSPDLDIMVRLLTHDALVENGPEPDISTDYQWNEIGLDLVRRSKKRALKLADVMLSRMGDSQPMSTILPQSSDVLNAIAFQWPNDVWELVTRHIVVLTDEKSRNILNWMRGSWSGESDSFLDRVDFEHVLDWIDRDPDRNAVFIARRVRPILAKNSLARNLIARYGYYPSVLHALGTSFSTTVFYGSAATYYQSKRDELLAYGSHEDDANVKNWIDNRVKYLDGKIEREKRKEERDH